MIILGIFFPSLQKMTTFTNVAQLMVKKNNARDYTMVEIYKVQLRSRETLINNVDFNNNTIGYDNCKFIMY